MVEVSERKTEDIKSKWHIVVCRICGKEMLFPKETYKEEWLIGWECPECRRIIGWLKND